jgi:probable F420-dependent oxidoreductase
MATAVPSPLERLGVTFASLPSLGVSGAVDVAATARDLGYRSFWTAETVGAEAFALLAAVGGSAPELDLGTGIIALQLRTPQVAAMGAATLQALHPDRDIYLGIGISSPVVTGQWHGTPFGERPLARVREYVALVRACLSGETVNFVGDFWTATRFRLGVRLGERRPKIVIGALNERMLRLAGEVADGVLLNYLPASHVPWSVEQVRKGGGATIMAYVHAGVVADRAEGLDAARRDLYSYAMVDSYAASFERAGYSDEINDVRQRYEAGDRDGAVRAITDRMVDGIDYMGSPEEVRRFVTSYTEAGVDVPVLMPLPWGRDRMAVTTATMQAAIA